MLTGIASAIFAVLVAIYTAFILPSLQDYLKARVAGYNKQREDAEANRNKINLTYLNPLRLWLEEAYVRLSEISAILADQETVQFLLFVDDPKDISNQEAEWFNGKGCYLVSTCYITACLFFAIKQVRDNIPYLRLSRENDTVLMTLLFRVSHSFLQDFGIFYVTQPSIGNDMYLPERNRLMTYREFCEILKNPEKRVWFDRLLTFYIETGKGEKRGRIQLALNAIRELSGFLDHHIGKGVAIEERLKAERIFN